MLVLTSITAVVPCEIDTELEQQQSHTFRNDIKGCQISSFWDGKTLGRSTVLNISFVWFQIQCEQVSSC
jgi:hypothetical protein